MLIQFRTVDDIAGPKAFEDVPHLQVTLAHPLLQMRMVELDGAFRQRGANPLDEIGGAWLRRKRDDIGHQPIIMTG